MGKEAELFLMVACGRLPLGGILRPSMNPAVATELLL